MRGLVFTFLNVQTRKLYLRGSHGFPVGQHCPLAQCEDCYSASSLQCVDEGLNPERWQNEVLAELGVGPGPPASQSGHLQGSGSSSCQTASPWQRQSPRLWLGYQKCHRDFRKSSPHRGRCVHSFCVSGSVRQSRESSVHTLSL